MCRLSTFSLLIAVTITLAFGSPVSKRQSVWTGARISDCKCHALPKKVSDYCGYQVTQLPNARGHETIAEALREFNDFALLLTDSPCSDHLGVLLCFHYFPFSPCTPGEDIIITSKTDGCDSRKVTPCNSTCVAAKSESCTNLILQHIPTGWADHFDCSIENSFPIEYVTPNRLCANTSSILRKNYVQPSAPTPKPEVTTPTPSEVTTEIPSVSTPKLEVTTPTPSEVVPSVSTPKPEVTTPTEAPTTKAPPCPCLKSCSIRNAANGKTFTRNLKYSYAIKATITEQVDSNTYRMTVHKSFNLQTCIGKVMQNAVHIDDNTEQVLLHVKYGHCSNSPDLVAWMNKMILIAGTYSEDNELQLASECSKGTGLIDEWESKFENNMMNWVANGNNARRSKC